MISRHGNTQTIASFRSLWARLRLLLCAVGLVALGYLFFSLAVNSGSLWQWTLALVLVVMGLRYLFLSMRSQGKQA